jgi:hypothetical protein
MPLRYWELKTFEHDECIVVRHEVTGERDQIEYHQCWVKVLRFDALPPPRDVVLDPPPDGVPVNIYGPKEWGIGVLKKGKWKFLVGDPFAPEKWSALLHW